MQRLAQKHGKQKTAIEALYWNCKFEVLFTLNILVKRQMNEYDQIRFFFIFNNKYTGS